MRPLIALFRFAALFVVLHGGVGLAAPSFQQCVELTRRCVDGPSVRIIAGRQLTRCWEEQVQYRCQRPQPVENHCGSLRAAGACRQTGSVCARREEGVCVRWRDAFTCLNAEPNAAPGEVIERTGTQRRIVRERVVDACARADADAACSLKGEVCAEGPETRLVNGLPVARSCWRWEKTHTCLGSSDVSTCSALEADQTCRREAESCIGGKDRDGVCLDREVSYICGFKPEEDAPEQTVCGSQKFCIGSDCSEAEGYQPNEGFARAAAWTNLVIQAGANAFDPQSLQTFAGKARACGRRFGSGSDCCADSGLLLKADLSSCNEGEKALIEHFKARTAHYIGTRCSQRVLGVCIERKRVYCAFSSRLGRILHEQARPQLGRGWGSVDMPDCAGLKLDEINAIDFSLIDLSEFAENLGESSLPPDVDMPEANSIGEAIARRVRSFQRRKDPAGRGSATP